MISSNCFFKSYPQFIPESMKHDTERLYGVIILRNQQGFYTSEHTKVLSDTFRKYQNHRDDFKRIVDTYPLNYNRNLSADEVDMIFDILALTASDAVLSPNKNDNFMNRYDYFYKSFKVENPLISKIYEESLKKSETKLNINYEQYTCELLFNFYTHIDGLRKFHPYYVGIHSDFVKQHARSLLISMNKYFPVHTFEIFDSHKNYDYVISTHNSLENVDDDKVIKVSDYINLKDLEKIYTQFYLSTEKKTIFDYAV